MTKFTVLPKKVIWHLAIWKIGVFWQFYDLQIESKHFVCLSFSGERLNLRELRGFILKKVQAIDYMTYLKLRKKNDCWQSFGNSRISNQI